jgi:hypothetical protein
MTLRGIDFTGMAYLTAIALLGIAGVAIYARIARAGSLSAALPNVPDAINPASPDNVIYRGVNAAVGAATGREETLGTWVAGLIHDPPASAVTGLPRPAQDAAALSGQTMALDDADAVWFWSRYSAGGGRGATAEW